MNKNFLRFVFLLAFMLAGNVLAQWTPAGNFPPDTTDASTRQTGNVHGLAVDPDGKVWAVNYYRLPRDTVHVPFWKAGMTQNGDTVLYINKVYVYNPDGTLFDFPVTGGVKQENPITYYRDQSGVIQDTLGGDYPWVPTGTWLNTGKGCRADANGNVVAAYFNIYYRFDYKTGLGMGMVKHLNATGGAASITSPAFSSTNKMFTANVAGDNPIREWDASFNEVGVAVPKSKGFSRAFEVSKDGNTIYWAGYTTHCITVYHRTDEFSPFDSIATIGKGLDIESFAWDPKNPDWLWVGSGSGNDLPNRYTEPDGTPVVTSYSPNAWYALDVVNNVVKDSVKWQDLKDPVNQRPRAMAFSPDGNTVYVSIFGWGFYDAMQKFTRSTTPPTVEFRANMSVQLKKGTFSTGDKVFVRGDFNGWGGTDYELKDVDGDSVYSAVFSNFTLGQKIIFKYTNNHGGADVWESTGNREITVVGGPNVYTACWEDVCVYVPSKTIQVAFSVNMELERLSGLFKPASDTVSARGSFNGWGQTVMTASPTNVDVYEVVTPVIASVGEKVSFKYFYTPGTWEVNQLTDPTQDNRYFVVSQADFDAASISLNLVGFNNGSLETVLNQPANIKFTCNTNGASIINTPTGTEFKTVHMAGGNSPLQWPGGGWPDADITKVIQLYDDGTHSDAVSGDKIFTTVVTFPQYATLNVVYKYGANWGLSTNGGANDNEAGVGSDKTLKMGRYTASATVVDTFGIVHITDVTKVEKLGNTIPTAYMLEQNYPNPFNPETSIRFSVPQESFVTVKVFNTLGEEVMTLVNEEKSAGVYNVSFKANNLTSGIYFYTIKANDFTSTKKMILMK